MKIILETCLLGYSTTDELQKNMVTQIGKWQDEGYEVDIHYAMNNEVVSVMLEKYKNV